MSIEAMKLAIEAIKDLRGYRPDIDGAIEALRSALAQQPATGEPVMDVRCEGCGYMTHHREHMGCVRAAKQHTHPAPGVPDDVVRVKLTPLTDAQMEKGREQIFSVNNPYCPCDRKTFKKVAQWVEAHHAAMLTAAQEQKGQP